MLHYSLIRQRKLAVLFLASAFLVSAAPRKHATKHVRTDVYTATAYSDSGKTASGQYTHQHIVAADPDLLPLGTRIKIKWAGRYSGEYVVADTGRKIQGRTLDIFIPSVRASTKFGRRPVSVKVLQLGENTQASAKQADQVVKADVKRDITKDGQEGAATPQDLAAAGKSTALVPAENKTLKSKSDRIPEPTATVVPR